MEDVYDELSSFEELFIWKITKILYLLNYELSFKKWNNLFLDMFLILRTKSPLNLDGVGTKESFRVLFDVVFIYNIYMYRIHDYFRSGFFLLKNKQTPSPIIKFAKTGFCSWMIKEKNHSLLNYLPDDLGKRANIKRGECFSLYSS